MACMGDGTNDSPALRKSDVGVALGITGTDISREASDLILLDDNLNTFLRGFRISYTLYEYMSFVIEYVAVSTLTLIGLTMFTVLFFDEVLLQPNLMIYFSLII